MLQAKDLPAPADRYPVRRALLSVFDKTGLVDFARRLAELDVALLSSGGTARALREAGLAVTEVADYTGFPELLDGRVKTLHPAVHAGLLARRTDPDDLTQLAEHDLAPIDLVVVNLYPFEQVAGQDGISEAEAAEHVDIGGPAMVRAAAKNFFFVGVVTTPNDYDAVAAELERADGALTMATRRRLAHTAFARTARYDQAVAAYFDRRASEPADASGKKPADEPAEKPEKLLPETLRLHLPRVQTLRYGENPHQRAALYGRPGRFFTQLHGKDLSFNNLLDLGAALQLIDEFRDDDPVCAILKHTNPCGVAVGPTLLDAYRRAFATDRQSPFGGIVAVNRPLDRDAAEALDELFIELVIAPAFDEDVLTYLKKKKNRRIIQQAAPTREAEPLEVRTVPGGVLAQERDPVLPPLGALRASYHVVTERAPTDAQWRDLDFAWRVAKHVKSNAIVYARERATLGIGAGQMSRVDASELAVWKGRQAELDFAGAVVASDAFFPFADGLVAAARSGARAVIQPGGSIRDEEVIAAANEHDIAMVFTGSRHFRH